MVSQRSINLISPGCACICCGTWHDKAKRIQESGSCSDQQRWTVHPLATSYLSSQDLFFPDQTRISFFKIQMCSPKLCGKQSWNLICVSQPLRSHTETHTINLQHTQPQKACLTGMPLEKTASWWFLLHPFAAYMLATFQITNKLTFSAL